jgi:hypothetical protein
MPGGLFVDAEIFASSRSHPFRGTVHGCNSYEVSGRLGAGVFAGDRTGGMRCSAMDAARRYRRVFLRPPEAGGPPPFLHPMLIFLAGLLLVKAIVGFAAGWGLLQREPWARIVAVFLAFLAMFFDVPFGAALGIYTLWVLLPAKSEEEYEAQVRSFGARRS